MPSKHPYSKPVHTTPSDRHGRRPAALRYVLLHKPFGVLSQFTPELPGQRTLAEFELPEELYAAGRLDSDSEGLLLLTNDGPLIKQLLEPGKHDRTYLVQVEGIVSKDAVKRLENGVRVQEYLTLPAKCHVLDVAPILPERVPPIRERKSIPTSWIELTLREGKNRQVRKMTAAVGNPTLRLIRTRIAGLDLGALPLGSWRDLSQEELQQLRRATSPALRLRSE